MTTQTICIVGLGYIGLPSAALLASKGLTVIGCDIQPRIVETINKGEVHLIEPGLEILVREAIYAKKLTAQLTIPKADIYVITVPTPVTEKNEPDISYVKSAIDAIASQLENNNLVILESTSPVGTTDQALKWIQQARPDLDNIYLAYCPERVMPGQIIRELVENDRIVGGINLESTQKAIAFYQLFVKGECIATNARTAEMTKLTENAFRDVNIAFANELSMICDAENINVWELIKLANRHPRVNILQPGPGVGGHCIAVDPWFIVARNQELARLIRSAREVNDYKARYVLRKILKAVNQIEQPIIACLGLAFKKNVDDLRESPALMIAEQLAEKTSGTLLVVEPHIKSLPQSLSLHQHVFLTDLDKAIADADIIVLLVAHTAFTIEKLGQHDEKLLDFVGLISENKENKKINHPVLFS